MTDDQTNTQAPKKLALPMILIIVGAMTLALLIVSALFRWMPTQASTFAGDVDFLYYFIYWISVFFTLLIAGTLVFFLLYYKQTDKAAEAPGKTTHSTALELTWTIIPVFIVLAIFAFGFKFYANMAVAPSNSYEIVVFANQWGWGFQYPNGYVDNDLHIPADRDIKLIMQSADVIHSLYIKQFRAKKDVVPGRFNTMWFHSAWNQKRMDRPDGKYKTTLDFGEGNGTADVLTYDLYCTEYCGQSHAQMNRKVYVHETRDGFDKWLTLASDPRLNPDFMNAPEKWGQKLWEGRCASCHTNDGSAGSGPTWKNLFASEREFTDGSKATADENYIRESILYPQRQIVKGYENQNMASFNGQLKDRDIYAIVQYIKSISDGHNAADNWGDDAEEAATEE